MTIRAETCTLVVAHFGDPEVAMRLVVSASCQLIHQVIVVDDCSPIPFPETDGVTVIRREVNGGFGAAVNTGAHAATGDLLMILNSDLEIGPTFVSDFLKASAPFQPAVTGPAVLDRAGHTAYTGRHFPTVGHQTTEWLTPLARFRDRPGLHEAVGHDTRAVPGATVAVDWLVGAALLIPRAAFLEVGGFDESFHMNSEEIDLQRRLRAHGLPSVFVGTVSVVHEGGASSDPALRRRWLVDSRFTYAEKWGGVRRLRTALRAATAVNLAANVARRAAGNSAARPLVTAREEWSLTTGGRR